MKVVAALVLLAPVLALAQASTPGQPRGPDENVTYGYAQVLRATRAYEIIRIRTPEQRCESRKSNKTNGVASAPRCRTILVEREERRPAGYDVEYLYRGEKYMSRLNHDPGNRLRVRVSVTPEDQGLGAR